MLNRIHAEESSRQGREGRKVNGGQAGSSSKPAPTVW